MVLAAASLDDIISICGFGVSFNLAFSQIDDSQHSSLALLVLNAPISLCSGFLIGFASAYCQYFLTRQALVRLTPGGVGREVLLSAHFRGGLLLAVSIAVVFALDLAGFSAGGYLAVMVQACVLATLWNGLSTEKLQQMSVSVPVSVSAGVGLMREEEGAGAGREAKKEGGGDREGEYVGAAAVSALYKTLWRHAQPALFMLIGAEVLFRHLTASSLHTAAVILLLATSVRLLVTFLSVSTSPVLVARERMFVCLAWLPKATVQAAIGSLVLDAAREMDIDDDGATDDAIEVGEIILTLAVLSILVTAPIGAVGIFVTGPRWLEREEGRGGDDDDDDDDDDGDDDDDDDETNII
jgi:NhaP-type Na+/H+ or K+/H+ antiporter